MKSKPWITTALRVSINNKYVSTKSVFHEHSSLIFKHLNIVNLPNLVQIFFNIKVFVYKFHNRCLPSVLILYNTRSISNMFYTLPKVQTNYGIFNIRFKGPKVWNSTCENLKTFSILNFKESVKAILSKIISYLYSYQQLSFPKLPAKQSFVKFCHLFKFFLY